jgi:hypothetical protein
MHTWSLEFELTLLEISWRFAALLPFGDPKKSEDWAVYKFHDFNVPYLAM